jgi:hypothetical protein
VGVKYRANLSFQKNPITDADRKVGGRQGALIRKIAQRSIRKRKAVSEPGKPPTNREGTLKRFIFFSWDEQTRSVFIGPERLDKPGSVPSLLEHGGMGDNNGRRVLYKARPTMQLALAEAMQYLPDLWAGAVN